MVDKNLFLHDLAVVAILKNEGHYLKEWLDYHLLAGVDHFYLYDNESPDNQAEVAKPYVEAGLVDYFSFPGKAMQYAAYNDAVKRFKFFDRYMAFIDGDEFIYPKNYAGVGIIEVVDEILSHDNNAAGLAIHFHYFGSNGHEKADYSRGVLERFTRRAENDWKLNSFIKTIADPRKIKFFDDPHAMKYFAPFHSVDENSTVAPSGSFSPASAEKIVVNHYYTKSREEHDITKMQRGWACANINPYSNERFDDRDRNEVFDDGILKYRIVRAEKSYLKSTAERINRVAEALTENLSEYADGKKFSIETALTCRALSTYLREKYPQDVEYWRICEEASLSAILNSLNGMNIVEAMIFIRELPNLQLQYPIVGEINRAALQIMSQMKDFYRLNGRWKEFTDLDYIQELIGRKFL